MSAVVLAFLFVAHTHTHRAPLYYLYIAIMLFCSAFELRSNRNANISIVCVYAASFTHRIIHSCSLSLSPSLSLATIHCTN